MKKILTLLIAISLLSVTFVLADKPTSYDGNGKALGLVGDAGFDEFGYNRVARIFSGTCESWHMGKFSSTEAQAEAYCGIYSDDKLVMKWNAEWDRGNEEKWANPPYAAWENNEWNGMCDGCSGEIWHYNIQWVGSCGADYTPLPDGGYCLWGQFEVLMSQGTANGEHIWDTHATPTGYGA